MPTLAADVDIATELAHGALAEMAPEELPLFDVIELGPSRRFGADGRRAVGERRDAQSRCQHDRQFAPARADHSNGVTPASKITWLSLSGASPRNVQRPDLADRVVADAGAPLLRTGPASAM